MLQRLSTKSLNLCLRHTACVRQKHFSSQTQWTKPKDSDWKDLTPSHLKNDKIKTEIENEDLALFPHKSDPTYNSKRTGSVVSLSNNIATVEGGLYKCKQSSLIKFDNGSQGIVLTIDENRYKIGLLYDSKTGLTPRIGTTLNLFENINAEPPKVSVGPSMIGKVVNPLSQEIDFIKTLEKQKQAQKQNRQVSNEDEKLNENKSKELNMPSFTVNMFPNDSFIPHWTQYSRNRERIFTGIKSIDTFYPMAKGWRTAIVGNKDLKRSDIAIDILLSFAKSNEKLHLKDRMYCIYVMIGKSEEEIIDLYRKLESTGALEYTTIVASLNDDSLTLQYLTPYTGCAMADFFKYYSMNSFIIYDDFSIHNQVTSMLMQESSSILNYGNWSGQLLERACQVSSKYGHGSHSALVLADKIDHAKDNGETFYYYLPYLQSHVDSLIELSFESFNRKLIPPISLLPVPYGSPKFHKGYLHELSNCVRSKLFEMQEMEKAFRQQMEIGLDLEPDIEKIASSVFKMEVMFNQSYETSFAHLLLCLSSIEHGIVEDVHLDWIYEFETKLLDYFENATLVINKDSNNSIEKIQCLKNAWDSLNKLGYYDDATEQLKSTLKIAFSYFVQDNPFLFQPKPLK